MPAKRISSTIDILFFHQQLDACVERGFGQLYGAHVCLRDGEALGAVVQQVGKGAAVFEDARCSGGERAVDDAVFGDDAAGTFRPRLR